MITLNSLPEASAQDVFDQVAFHLLNQGEHAVDADLGDCMYHGHNGLSCAAGCLISDEEYDYAMEWNSWSDLVDTERVPANHSDLIFNLQHLHDTMHPDDWADSLSILADKYGLTVSPELRKAMQVYTEERVDDY